jgi:Na+/melibiose symporter-like transporter
LGIFYKILTEADTSVAFNIVSSVYSFFAAHVWRNPNSTQLDVTANTRTDSSGGIPDCPAITTVTDKAIVLAVGAAAGSGTYALNGFTVPSGMTNFFQDTISNIAGVAIASYLQTTAGAYNPPAFGGGNSSSSCTYCAATLAIRPK